MLSHGRKIGEDGKKSGAIGEGRGRPVMKMDLVGEGSELGGLAA